MQRYRNSRATGLQIEQIGRFIAKVEIKRAKLTRYHRDLWG